MLMAAAQHPLFPCLPHFPSAASGHAYASHLMLAPLTTQIIDTSIQPRWVPITLDQCEYIVNTGPHIISNNTAVEIDVFAAYVTFTSGTTCTVTLME
jgi:hypothetical protein